MPPDYRIDPQIFRLYPGYRRALVLAEGLHNGPSSEALSGELRAQEAVLRAELIGNPAEHPRIAAWREAYRRFGARPSDFRSSIEALVRRVARGDSLPSINALVDIGNLVSIRHLLPVGVHPVPAGAQILQLRLAESADRFLPPDGGPAETPENGEVVFTQQQTVLTRRWTWRQAASTLTVPETTAVFFNLDALSCVPQDVLDSARRDVVTLVQTHCGGRTQTEVLDADTWQWNYARA
jgi:DNA/RNA-binding domain of Phe-tRNA-synthetase-like protein